MVLGVTLVDGAFILASFLGVSALLRIMVLQKIILFAGAAALIYFGVKHFLASGKDDDRNDTITNSFFYGIRLTLTNPLTIIFWSGAFGLLMASGKVTGFINVLIYSLGCLTATLLFLSTVSISGKYISKVMNQTARKLINYFVGLYLIFYGCSTFFK